MQHVLENFAPKPKYSLIIPVYLNELNIPSLLDAVKGIASNLGPGFEVVFVVDGSPDRSYALLRESLPNIGFHSQLIALSRNFGSFPAIRVGLGFARGDHIAVMSADLQEPPDLVIKFFRELQKGEHDVAFGVRVVRDDPWTSTLFSKLFWRLYRHAVLPDIPEGGVDIFALQAAFRDELLRMGESNSSLLAQLFWLGGRRALIEYSRAKREHGKSAWTFSKKFRYLTDSVFSFTNLPIRAMTILGAIGLICAALLGAITLFAKITGVINIPGYAGIILAILFFGALNTFGIGIIGTYAWRTFENTKNRPLAVVQSHTLY